MRLPKQLLWGAAALVGACVVTGQPEFAVPALLMAGASAGLKIRAGQRDLQASLAQMENRLNSTEGELDAASSELEELKVEREFDRQLLRPPAPPSS
jgi:hypothetical protein